MVGEKINLVLLNLSIDDGISGVNRYIDTIRKEARNHPNILLHSVVLLEKPSMLFNKIVCKNECVDIVIPMPLNTREIIKEDYWMTRYSEVVFDMIEPYFRGKNNLIWNTHCINLSRLAVVLKNQLGGRILTHLHCIPWKFDMVGNLKNFVMRYQKYVNQDFENFNDNPVERLTYQTADKIVCVTTSASDYLVSCMNVEKEKIKIVSNGLGDVSPELGKRRNNKKIELLYVGRISKEKGMFELLNAMQILQKRGVDCRLIVAGSGHPVLLEKIRKNYGMLDIDFLGKVSFDKLQELYSACTIGVVPSLHEQCSYVAIEMAMFGVPMVVADVDGLAEMFTDNETALKIKLSFNDRQGVYIDPDEFALILERVITDLKLRNSLSTKVRQMYQEKYTSKRMFEDTQMIYQHLI